VNVIAVIGVRRVIRSPRKQAFASVHTDSKFSALFTQLCLALVSFVQVRGLPDNHRSVLLLNVGFPTALAGIGDGRRSRSLGGIQMGIDSRLILLKNALQEVVVDESSAIPPGVAKID